MSSSTWRYKEKCLIGLNGLIWLCIFKVFEHSLELFMDFRKIFLWWITFIYRYLMDCVNHNGIFVVSKKLYYVLFIANEYCKNVQKLMVVGWCWLWMTGYMTWLSLKTWFAFEPDFIQECLILFILNLSAFFRLSCRFWFLIFV